jgi:hypothetical protein
VCCWLYALLADVLDWYQCNLPKDSTDQQQHELEDVESGESAAGASRKQQQHLLPKHGKHLQRKTVSARWVPITSMGTVLLGWISIEWLLVLVRRRPYIVCK